jgi:hypothetical protein
MRKVIGLFILLVPLVGITLFAIQRLGWTGAITSIGTALMITALLFVGIEFVFGP